MSTENKNWRWVYQPNGVSTSFVYDNLVLAESDLIVRGWLSTGDAMALPAHTVTGVGSKTGGNVVFNSPPLEVPGSIIEIVRQTEKLQGRIFKDFVQETASVREAMADRAILGLQESEGLQARGLSLSPLESGGPMVLPPPAIRAGKALMWGLDGSLIADLPVATDVPGSTLTNTVPNIAALRLNARPVKTMTVVARETFGDGGGGPFAVKPGDTTTPDDGVLCVVDLLGNRWWRSWDGHTVNSLWFTSPDGIHDDFAALFRAQAIAQIAGRTLKLTPGRAAYVLSDTLFLGNGVKLEGVGGFVFPGTTAPNAAWTTSGSWIKPTHPTNPAVQLHGHGSGIRGINFIHDQPLPTGGPWAPTSYGYCIKQIASHCFIENVRIVNASHGIDISYNSVSGGGTNCWIRDVIVSAYEKRINTSCVNDTMYWSDIHCRNLWHNETTEVVTYIRANTIGWECGYTDNIIVDGMEFFEEAIALRCTNETALGISHSLYNATLNNIQFNLPQKSVVATGTTDIRVHWGTVIAQQGNAFGYTWSDTMFDLRSNNVLCRFSQLNVIDAGGKIFDLGNGSGGSVTCAVLDIENYSTVAAGQTGISMAAGAKFDAGVVPRFVKNGSAGLRVAGAGSDLFTTARMQQWAVFSVFGQYAGIAGTGAYANLSIDNFFRPGVARVYQARLQGNVDVTTSSATTTATQRLSGISACVTAAYSTAAAAVVNFDSGWVDITEAELAALATLGRVQHNTNAEVQFSTGDSTVLIR